MIQQASIHIPACATSVPKMAYHHTSIPSYTTHRTWRTIRPLYAMSVPDMAYRYTLPSLCQYC
eukprot:3137305-Rhodomonas_salina.1